MKRDQTVQFFMEKGLCQSAQAGQHNFLNKVAGVLEEDGFAVEFCNIDNRGGAQSIHTLTHMKPPVSQDGLIFRRVYHYPFWQIEQSEKRWEWHVAKSSFAPKDTDKKEANRFFNFWGKRLFGKVNGPKADDGFIYMPLQGRLLQHRSFQSCSPIEMIERTLAAFPNHKVIATLHPKEDYSKAELDQVEWLEKTYANLEFRLGQMEALLERCAFVVTQNSSAAFNGYFFEKPAILFGKIDFHHIALDGMTILGSDEIAAHQPEYAQYVHWFWQEQSINAGHPSAQDKIRQRFKRFEWIK